jgi:hypothetical protein
MNVDLDSFVSGFGVGDRPSEIARLLWDMLRDLAFVPDFRPDSGDSLSRVYAMGPEEVLDDLIEPLLAKLGLSVSGIDFTGFDLALIDTPMDVVRLMVKVAEAQNGVGSRRIDNIEN